MDKQNKKTAIIQSSYIPWKGYFDIINMVDEFILYDTVQYTRRDWRNRNRIKTPQGSKWLTIPVEVKGKYYQNIRETEISDANWGRKHWSSIKHNYLKAKYFKEYKEKFEELFLNTSEKYLSLINYKFIDVINNILGITTKISWSSDYDIDINVDKTEKIVILCKKVGATEYISGPSAKSYIKKEYFNTESIKLTWMDYSNYPEYTQIYPPFDHYVSIIDLIFNEGMDATKYMKSFKKI